MKLDRKKIRIAMIKAGISFKDLAERYGASKQRVTAIANSCMVRPATAEKLARCLGCDLNDILQDDES